MIIKYFDLKKIDLNLNKFVLLYGKNDGLKNESIENLTKDKGEINNYDEKEILDNQNSFLENILSKSLFEKSKIIIIKRTTDKILKIIEEIKIRKFDDVTIILNSENLEKKSKLRSFFEKDEKLICIPFYPDNDQTLSKLAYNFLTDKKISISPSNIKNNSSVNL